MNYPNLTLPLLENGIISTLAGDRVYRTRADDSPPGPYVVWEPSLEPNNMLGCTPDSDNYRIRINCYALAQNDSRKLIMACSAIAEEWGYIEFGPSEEFEDETLLYRNFLDFSGIAERS